MVSSIMDICSISVLMLSNVELLALDDVPRGRRKEIRGLKQEPQMKVKCGVQIRKVCELARK